MASGSNSLIKMPRRWFLLLLFVAAPIVTSAAQVYSCGDAHGTQTYSDQPCPKAMQSPYKCADRRNGLRTFDGSACGQPKDDKAPPGLASGSARDYHQTIEKIGALAQVPFLDQVQKVAVSQLIAFLSIVWPLLIFVLALAVLKTPRVKGYVGELVVRAVLAVSLPKALYRVLHDVTLLRGDGTTTQIDHVVVSRFGLFVIETKNMSGWIFGRENDANWAQVKFRYKGSFQNPIRQNWLHLSALSELLAVPLEHQHSLVVFLGSADFKRGKPEGVYGVWQFAGAIHQCREEVFSPIEAARIWETLQEARLPAGRATSRRHLASLRERNGR